MWLLHLLHNSYYEHAESTSIIPQYHSCLFLLLLHRYITEVTPDIVCKILFKRLSFIYLYGFQRK